MRLRHLTLQGYKSFANRTEFLFSPGITAIVGPNGSGKSNVADAIRWVLGEQSLHLLRGKSTADLIFAGGRKRSQAGMAEVSLVLDNADAWLPVDFGEVTITRRAYRNGENEYLVNGARVRLRDIMELLAESGLSQRAYVVIGQGLVDAALSLRPQERRALFEEAAGITFYRLRREETLQRLEETQRNLERVQDIIHEISPRLAYLEIEAQKVEERQRLSAHLKRLQRTWYGYQWRNQQAALAHAQERAAAFQLSVEEKRHSLAAVRERITLLRSRESELRVLLRTWHQRSADVHQNIERAQRELAVAEERLQLVQARHKELIAELEALTEQQHMQSQLVEQVDAEVHRLEQELALKQAKLNDLEAQWHAMREQFLRPARRQAHVERVLEARRVELNQLTQAARSLQMEIGRKVQERAMAQERTRQLALQLDRLKDEQASLERQRASQVARVAQVRATLAERERVWADRQRALAECEQSLAALQGRVRAPSAEYKQVEEELSLLRAALDQQIAELNTARAELARLGGERDALEQLQSTHVEHGDTAVRAVLEARVDGCLGTLGSLLEIPGDLEELVEQALGEQFQVVVVENTACMQQIEQLLAGIGDRVTLLPLDRARCAVRLPEQVARLMDLVGCTERIRPAAEAVLGLVVLCRDRSAAEALVPVLPPGSLCVVADGTVLHASGAISVGRTRADRLTSERARGVLIERIAEAEERCRQWERTVQATQDRVMALEEMLRDMRQQEERQYQDMLLAQQEALAQARADVAVAEEALRNERAALEREIVALRYLDERIAQLQAQIQAVKGELDQVPAHLRSDKAQAVETAVEEQESSEEAPFSKDWSLLAEFEHRQHVYARRIARLEQALTALTQQVTTGQEEVARFERDILGPARTEVAVVKEALRNQRVALEREKGLLERIEVQAAARRERLAGLEQEGRTVGSRLEELRAEMSALRVRADELRRAIQPAEEEMARLEEELRSLDAQERDLQNRLREAETRYEQARAGIERESERLRALLQRIEDELGLVRIETAEHVATQQTLPLYPLVSELPLVEELPDGLEKEIQQIQAALRRLGEVNPNAPQEYAELKERYQFLAEQSSDLEKGIAQLRQAVDQLDTLMESAFRETFEAVAAKFAEIFPVLFNGGAARLELLEPHDLMNTGIEIIAQPPGKRSQRLALLSGGERALTAVALLFALLQVSPTPFCVLDEVDAMLDEANVFRFRSLLEELAQRTQFIVITHNRVTIEAADTVYGVSMGADGVSQVVSLRLS